MPEGKRPTIQRQMSGSIDLVRITAGYQSIGDMMDSAADIASNPNYNKLRDNMNRLTVSVVGFNYKVVHANLGLPNEIYIPIKCRI
mgnify:CR=1 FL=1